MKAESDVLAQVTEQIERVNARMSKVKHKIAVMSGKGGVGKSVVTANLALALALQDYTIGILDVDINGPALPKILGLADKPLKIGPQRALPAEGPLNIKVMSMDLLLLGKETPVIWDGLGQSEFVWRGAMEMSTIREFLSDIQWGKLDLLLFDLPAGTAQMSNLAQLLPDLEGVIGVTIPSEVSLFVVKKAITFAKELKVPVIGLIENMSGFNCPECREVIDLFGQSNGKKISKFLNVPFLGKIPFDPRLAECADSGVPFVVEYKDSLAGKAFTQIANKIGEYLK